MFNRLKSYLSLIINRIHYKYIVSTVSFPKVLSRDETLDTVINNHMSVSRFGDGEYDLIQGRPLKFQSFDNRLSTKLKEVLYSNIDTHLVCLPDIYSGTSELKNGSSTFAEETLRTSAPLLRPLSCKRYYGNAYITRFYMALKPERRELSYPDKLRLLWDNHDLLIVEGAQSRLGVGNDLFYNAKSIKRILCPSENSFAKYDDIVGVIKKQHTTELVLLALGPTATVMAYDLAEIGIRSIDIGHVDIEYEWFLMGTEEKVDIPNKHVNEASGLPIDGHFNDSKYLSEVIEEVL